MMMLSVEQPTINKVAAVVIKEGRLLVVRKQGEDIFISPGGKPEAKESNLIALQRELKEEVGLELTSADYLGTYESISATSNHKIKIDAFIVSTVGDVSVGNEIAEHLWICGDFRDYGVEVGSVFSEQVIPQLISMGLMDAASVKARDDKKSGVFIFDLDETLVHHNAPLSQAIIRKIEDILYIGHHIIFASARAKRGIYFALPESLSHLPMVCCNGAIGYINGEPVIINDIPASSSRRITEHLDSMGVTYQVEYEPGFDLVGDIDHFPFLKNYGQKHVYKPEQDGRYKGAVKISIAYQEKLPNLIKFFSAPEFKGFNFLNHRGKYLDVIAPGIHKYGCATTLLEDHVGANDCTKISFGNDHNDFELLVRSDRAYVVGKSLSSIRYAGAVSYLQPDESDIIRAIDSELEYLRR